MLNMCHPDRADDRPTPVDCDSASVSGVGAIFAAVQHITSSKWAGEKIRQRDAAKSSDERCGGGISVVRQDDGRIPWSTVKLHNHAGSCWMVIKNKVRSRASACVAGPGARLAS